MELLKVLDENGKFTNQILDREVIHTNGLWHQEVTVWIFNSKGEVLIQRRNKNKKMAPNKLSTCAGHVKSDETSIIAIQNELFEEVGLKKEKSDIFYLTTEKKEKKFSETSINRIFNDVYYTITDKTISEFKIQKEELSEIIWINYLDYKNRILNEDTEIITRIAKDNIKTFELLDNLYSKITNN